MNAQLQTQREWHAHYQAIRSRIFKAGIVRPAKIQTDANVVEAPPSAPPVPVVPIVMIPPPPPPGSASDMAKRFAKWQIPSMKPRTRLICLAVCERTQTKWPDFISPSRGAHIVYKRQRLMFALRWGTKLSLPQIGRLLGGRDHTTILYGVKEHAARRFAERGR